MYAFQINTGNGDYGITTWQSGKYSSCRIYHKKRRKRIHARSNLHKKQSSRLSHYHISMKNSRKKKKDKIYGSGGDQGRKEST